MKLDIQKRLASSILKAGKRRVKLNVDKSSEIKEAITRSDIRSLINNNVITKVQKHGISRGRTRQNMQQKRKGRRSGKGSFKGVKTSRSPRKLEWINKVRSQRKYLKYLKDKEIISVSNYRLLRQKVKGGLFRSVRHIKLYMQEYNLIKKKDGN